MSTNRVVETHAGETGNRTVRVLHICTRYRRGGSERRIRDLVAALPDLRHDLVIGADSDADLALEQTGVDKASVLPTLQRAVSPLKDLRSAKWLWSTLRSGRYGLVVTHQSKAGALGRTVSWAAGGPAAVHSLSMASFGPGYGRLEGAVFRRLERLLGRHTAAFCVVGSDLADRYRAIGVPAERLHVVRSGIPLPSVTATPAEARYLVAERFGIPLNGPLLLYVGSLEARKNVQRLPDVLQGVQATRTDSATLLLVGEGPERPAVTQRLRGLGLEGHAVLTGHIDNDELVGHLIRAADVLLLLSRVEGLPQVLVQSAFAGTPFVAFDVEGVREILDLGAIGAAVPFGDVAAVIDAVDGLLSQSRADAPGLADLSSWDPATIAADYRRAVTRVLPDIPGIRPAPPPKGPK